MKQREVLAVGLEWVPPREVADMMVVNFHGFVGSGRSRALFSVANTTLLCMIWLERTIKNR